MIWHLAELWIALAVMFALGGFAGSLLQRFLARTRLARGQTALAAAVRTLVDKGRRAAGERASAVFSQPGARTEVVRAVAVGVPAETAAAPVAAAVEPRPVAKGPVPPVAELRANPPEPPAPRELEGPPPDIAAAPGEAAVVTLEPQVPAVDLARNAADGEAGADPAGAEASATAAKEPAAESVEPPLAADLAEAAGPPNAVGEADGAPGLAGPEGGDEDAVTRPERVPPP